MQRLVISPTAPVRTQLRGATLVVVVVLSIIATTVAAVLVQQLYLSASQERAAAHATQARGALASVRTEVEMKLAHDPEFFYNELFWAERPRECDTTSEFVAPTRRGDQTEWPEECGDSWAYLDPATQAPPITPAGPVRVEFRPPSATNSDLQVIYGAAINGTFVAEEVTYATPKSPTGKAPKESDTQDLQVIATEPLDAAAVCGSDKCWEEW